MIEKARVLKIDFQEKYFQVVVRKKSFGKYAVIAFTGFNNIRDQIENQQIKKGDFVRIEYKLSSKSYRSKQGDEKYMLSALIQSITLLEKDGYNKNSIFVDEETGEIIDHESI